MLFIPYFLDAFYAGQTPKLMPVGIKKYRAINLENKLLKNADRIIMMKAVEKVYKENQSLFKNYNNIIYLDLPLYRPVRTDSISIKKYFSTEEIVFFFAGATPRNIRNPQYILELFSLLADYNYHLYIAGSTDYNNLIKHYTTSYTNIHYLGEISHDKAKELSVEADFLVNIGNNLQNMVPSKIFEYMSLGKPILSTLKIPSDPSLGYLNEYGKSLIIDERSELQSNIKLLIEFTTSPITKKTDGNIFQLNRPSTFVECLRNVYSKHEDNC